MEGMEREGKGEERRGKLQQEGKRKEGLRTVGVNHSLFIRGQQSYLLAYGLVLKPGLLHTVDRHLGFLLPICKTYFYEVKTHCERVKVRRRKHRHLQDGPR